jgi:hypothetical protein
MRTGALVLVALGLAGLLGGCGIAPTDPLPFGEPATGADFGDQMYFLLDGKVFPTLRTAAGGTDPTAVLDALGAGPLPAEQAAGLTTEVPADFRVFGVKALSDSGADVGVFVGGDPTALSDLALSQITCTGTAALRRMGNRVERVTLIDRAGHRRGPASCALLGRPGDQ